MGFWLYITDVPRCHCGNALKYATGTLCEECVTNPSICPSISEFQYPSFMKGRDSLREKTESGRRRNPEQLKRAEEIHGAGRPYCK